MESIPDEVQEKEEEEEEGGGRWTRIEKTLDGGTWP